MHYTKERIAEFEAFVEKLMAEQEAPGVAVALADGERLVYSKGFGYRNQAEALPVTPETVFGIASITKSFTGMAIMQLEEQGKLSVDDPVVKHLPDFSVPKFDASEITIHHLLTHTSGLAPLPSLYYSMRAHTQPDEPPTAEEIEKYKNDPPVNDYADLIKFIAEGDVPMLGAAGQYFSYSNDSYALLGAIIEKVSGMPYDEFVAQNILQPLGMSRSVFSLQELQQLDNVTELYYKNDEKEVRHSANWQEAPPYLAGGWLRSCAVDLIKVFQVFANGGVLEGKRLLKPESIEKMIAAGFRFSLYNTYGYGLRIQPDYANTTLVEHGGSLKGVSSNAGFSPEKGVSAAILCNLSGVPVAKLWVAAMNLMLGLPIDNPRATYETRDWTAEEMDRLEGLYKSGEGAEIRLEREGGELMAKFKTESYPVKAINEETGLVCINGQEQELRFYPDDKGGVFGIGHGVRIIPRV